jgi:hypothetical protein
MTAIFNHWERNELTLDDIRQRAPSAFAEEPHSSRSDQYVYLPTYKVLEALYGEGFRAFQASQARSRKPNGSEYTKHLIRLRHPDMAPVGGGGVIPEIAFLNSHDGSSAFKLKLGMFRLVCLNGMVTGHDFAGVSVYHKGADIRQDVLEGAFSVVQQAPQLMESIGTLHNTGCSEVEAEVLAGSLLTYQYGQEAPPVEPFMLAKPRRPEDHGDDLWTRYNVIQENATKGGLPYRNSASGRRNTTRAVRGIDADLKINAALWDLTQQMLRLKDGTFDETLETELL